MDHVKLKDILDRKTASPYSFEEFKSHLKTQHTEELLDFWCQAREYQEFAKPLFENASKSTAQILPRKNFTPPQTDYNIDEKSQIKKSPSAHADLSTESTPVRKERNHSLQGYGSKNSLKKTLSNLIGKGVSLTEMTKKLAVEDQKVLRDKLQTIIDQFIKTDSPTELNVPGSMKTKILSGFDKGNYHPDIFKTVLEKVFEQMKLGNFKGFMRSIANAANEKSAAVNVDIEKVELRIEKELPKVTERSNLFCCC